MSTESSELSAKCSSNQGRRLSIHKPGKRCLGRPEAKKLQSIAHVKKVTRRIMTVFSLSEFLYIDELQGDLSAVV